MGPGEYTRTLPRASPVLRTCRHPWRRAARGTTAGALARAAAGRAHVTAWGTAPCTRSVACAATATPAVRGLLQAPLAGPVALLPSADLSTWPRRAALHAPGHPPGGAVGGGGRPAVPGGLLAPVARPPRLCPLRHPPELGRGGGEKADARVEAEHLDWALADFSGYWRADELYDGPFCVLSAVDARRQRRLLYEVLTTTPPRWTSCCSWRACTTAFAPTATRPGDHHRRLAALPATHCPGAGGRLPPGLRVHIKKELTKAVLHAVARLPQRTRGASPEVTPRSAAVDAGSPPPTPPRPTDPATGGGPVRAAPPRCPAPPDRRPAGRAAGPVRGLPCLRALRAIMTRCTACSTAAAARTPRWQVGPVAPAGAPLPQPGQEPGQVALAQPGEGAEPFLDDKLLPATSNAVERGNRRYRKMQKAVYRVRTQASIKAGWRWTCNGIDTPRTARKRSPACTKHEHDPKRQLPCYSLWFAAERGGFGKCRMTSS